MEEPVLFGLETEYGFTPLGPGGAVLDRGTLAQELMTAARKGRPTLADTVRRGFFLPNGSRIYVEEWGAHPEVATPECSDPAEVVSYARSGERLLELAARELEQKRPGSRILLFACNMDYGGSQETWGCHESYLHRSDHRRMVASLIPHLVSRILYTGAGGFHNRKPGLEFLISPRACQLRQTPTGARWFVNKHYEPLSRGHGRLHVVCGETLRSRRAAWLKVGVTALIVRVLDRGVPCGEAAQLADPVRAMLAIARDPTCRQKVLLADGRRRSALEIQEHYLAAVEGQLGRRFLPGWAEDVCREWRSMLEALRGAPESVQTTLDWAIKHRLFADEGVRAKLLECRAAGPADAGEDREPTLALFPDDMPGWTLPKRIPDAELCELDTRFGQLGGEGIFAQLQRAGVLSDAVEGVRLSEGFVEGPPPVGRAALRGDLVRRLAGRAGLHSCDWEGVIDWETARFADLRNPYESRLRWRPIEQGSLEWDAGHLLHAVRRHATDRARSSAPDPSPLPLDEAPGH